MPPLERILTFGITGSGKSFQWLKMAEALQVTGAIFRVIDSDFAIQYMLETKFSHLKNVYVYQAYDWPDYKKALMWVQGKLPDIGVDELKRQRPHLYDIYKKPLKSNDWVILEMADNAWSSVQRYFTDQVFQENLGDYFLEVRKTVRERGDVTVKGKPVKSLVLEGFSGWVDWPVVNKLYDDFALPLFYRTPCNIYTTTRVEKLSSEEKDPETLDLFGDAKIKPVGQKKLGHQHHTVLLYVPGQENWLVTTIKDRADRLYFKKTRLSSLYYQYLVAKAGWPILE